MLSIVLSRLRRRLAAVETLAAFLRWASWGGLLGVGLAAWYPLGVCAIPSAIAGTLGALVALLRERPDAMLAEVADQALGSGALFRTALEVPAGSRWGGPVHVSAMDAARALSTRRAVPLRLRHAGVLLALYGLAAAVHWVAPRIRWAPRRVGAAQVEVDATDLSALRALSGRLSRAADDQQSPALRAASLQLAELDRDLQENSALGELELLARLGGVRETLNAERKRVAGRAALRRTLAAAPGLGQLVREGRAPTLPETPEARRALLEAVRTAANEANDPELAEQLRAAASAFEEDPEVGLAELERVVAQLPARYADERTADEVHKATASLEELRATFGAPPLEELSEAQLASRLSEQAPEELAALAAGEASRDPELAAALKALDPEAREAAVQEALATQKPSRPAPSPAPLDSATVAERKGAPAEQGRSEPGEPAGESGRSEPGDPGETAQVEPGDPGVTAQVEPGDPGETAQVKPGDPGETAQTEPGDPGETAQVEPGDPGETAQVEPGDPGETAQSEQREQSEPGDPAAEAETANAEPAQEPERGGILPRTDRPPPGKSLAGSLLESAPVRLLAEELLETLDTQTLKELAEFAQSQAGDRGDLPDSIPPDLTETLKGLDPATLKKLAEVASELTPPDSPPSVPPGLAESLKQVDPELLRQLAEAMPPGAKPANGSPGGPQQGAATGRPVGSGPTAGGPTAGKPAAGAADPTVGHPNQPTVDSPGQPGAADPSASAATQLGSGAPSGGTGGSGGSGSGGGGSTGPGELPTDASFDERVAALDPALRQRVERWLERHPRRLIRTRANHEFDPGQLVNLEGVEEAMERERVPASYEGVIREYFRRDPAPEPQPSR